MPERREKVLKRLKEDLVGPYTEDEEVNSGPTDVYMTGILWPFKSRISEAEDEKLGVEGISGRSGDSPGSGEEEEVIVLGLSKPSSAGISFAVFSEDGKPSISIRLSFGMYRPLSPDDEMSVDEEAENVDSKVESDEIEQPLWKRTPYSVEIRGVDLYQINSTEIDLEEYGCPSGVWIHIRTAPWERNKLVTVTALNKIDPGDVYLPENTGKSVLCQVSLEVTPEPGTHLIARPSGKSAYLDEAGGEDGSTALLYRNAREYATGHTCSAEWVMGDTPETAACVRTTWIPEAVVPATSPMGHPLFDEIRQKKDMQPFSAKWLASASDDELATALLQVAEVYDAWILIQQEKIPALEDKFRAQAESNLNVCRCARDRMKSGAERISADPLMAEAFRLANGAMQTQFEWERGKEEVLVWRPFQIGFVLLAFESVADRHHNDRKYMDLLWFPTGGGKTEAYLALIAFLLFYRRLAAERNPDEGAGVAAVMRYTLRLLTTQQFARASSMILACEAIRRGKISYRDRPAPDLGKVPFSIGLWVGGEATPNTLEDLATDRRGYVSPEQLERCPACHNILKWTKITVNTQITDVTVHCPNDKCILYDSNATLPVYTIDEIIYRERPSLLIGTVDKFAQIVRRTEIVPLFGIDSGNPPDLIIQDELHLISGPLGTMVGLYETALDRLLSSPGSNPKIIGSTATIRRASDQVGALFNRKTCQFPPPGIDADDSGFAVTDYNAPGRLYVGITTAGRSAKFTLQGVSASLLQSGKATFRDDEARDPYWTLVSYFNSLRELGGALVLVQDDVYDSISMISKRRGETELQRDPENVEELTSRRSQQEIRDMLWKLSQKAGNTAAVDVVLATNMVSVGVDISRLGLMLINGQPKGISEYIQATSRVGRSSGPGLVVAVLNNAKARDRSHYESFVTWHRTLYRDVESTSVTPFASRARDKALHAVLVALIRHLIPDYAEDPRINPDTEEIEEIVDYIAERAKIIDPEETRVRDELNNLLMRWDYMNPEYYWKRNRHSLLQDAERVAAMRALGKPVGNAWSTMNNMRTVEPSTGFSVILYQPSFRGKQE